MSTLIIASLCFAVALQGLALWYLWGRNVVLSRTLWLLRVEAIAERAGVHRPNPERRQQLVEEALTRV